jgi:hypothetical protein
MILCSLQLSPLCLSSLCTGLGQLPITLHPRKHKALDVFIKLLEYVHL